MNDIPALFPDLPEATSPGNGSALHPIGKRRGRYRPARTVLQRALWERRFAALGDQVSRLAMAVAKLERWLEIERRQSADNAEKISLVLLKVAQLGHDLHSRETPVVPPRHSRKRPLG